MEPFSSNTVEGLAREMGITVFVRVCLIINHGTIVEQNCRGSAREMDITVSVHVCLIMNHGTFLEQNCRGLAHEMVITVFVRGCLIMNHETIVQQNSRGSARDEFRCYCSCLFDYEPWNHIPQVMEGGMCDDSLCF